ncbi:hypothetical protein NJC40_23485 [Pseudomonas sp. 21LCFQ02]|uniref:hypothetical protein n=1 Tax=Pseudomonas sp. 21LCFQ02 TaxID=2957505 RepID=UPI00209B538B|nr:hypothetical protein [Pseudomonas sp. 21LCFQ02]MCO8170730.1 hypothetical protein [Pseudomonas sp. 21LCFQ02]
MRPIRVLTTRLRCLLISRWSLHLLICPTLILSGPVTLTGYRPPMSQLLRILRS